MEIHSTAHPHVLLQPLHFADAQLAEMTFQDGENNAIVIMPPFKNVFGSFNVGANLTAGIPTSYTNYLLFFGDNVNVTATDLDYMFQWTAATQLAISDERDVAYQLSERLDGMRAMKRLKSLTLDIHRDAYKKLRIRGFLKRLPSLRHGFFEPKRLTEAEVEEFVRNQDVPMSWNVKVTRSFVEYSKKWWLP